MLAAKRINDSGGGRRMFEDIEDIEDFEDSARALAISREERKRHLSMQRGI